MIEIPPDEKVLAVARKHWWVLFTRSIVFGVSAIAPLVIWFIATNLTTFNPVQQLSLFLWFVYFAWVLMIWIIFFIFWTDYYLDIWIITNKRVIDIEQKGLFNRETSTVRMENIQDITCDVHGVIAHAFDFGTLHLQTSGSEKEFTLPHTSQALEVKEFIMKQHDKVMEEHEIVRIHADDLQSLSQYRIKK